MLPWIMLGASLLQRQQAKKDAQKQAYQDLMIGRAQDLGADTTALRATQARNRIDDQPMVDPGLLASAIGSTIESQNVDEKLSKEMARRGLMKGYQPYDQASNDPEGDIAAALRYRNGMGGFGGYYGGGR